MSSSATTWRSAQDVTIDRGALGSTVIGKGTKIDNLVQIAHNVEIGERCLLVAQGGIAGSSKLGNYVVLAGQVGIAGHLKIGNQAIVAAQSGVMNDIPDGGKWLGLSRATGQGFQTPDHRAAAIARTAQTRGGTGKETRREIKTRRRKIIYRASQLFCRSTNQQNDDDDQKNKSRRAAANHKHASQHWSK